MSLDKHASHVTFDDGGQWDWIFNGLFWCLKDMFLDSVLKGATRYVNQGLPDHLNKLILDDFQFPRLFENLEMDLSLLSAPRDPSGTLMMDMVGQAILEKDGKKIFA
eukprot:GHVR01039484.1.p4 GENE.GHVR01039484.1~~GHVR01039484.1.p4  ORF type:complete len:107 (+),score=9.61 GHVR01039484.1:329-649(+)